MAASVSVGFSPATTKVVTGSSTVPAKQPAGTADLFAQLLAMLGIGQSGSAGAAPDRGSDVAGIVSQLLVDGTSGQAPAGGAAADGTVAADPASAPATPPAALFKQLKDALAALNEALDHGQSLDPDLKQKLDDLANALAGMLGLSVSQPTAVTVAGNAPDGGTPAATDPAAGAIPTTKPSDPTAPSPAIDPDSPLGQAIAELAAAGKALQETSPALAQKLDAIADKLASGQVPREVLAKLGLDAAAPSDHPAPTAIATRPAAAEPPQGFAAVALKPPTVSSAAEDKDGKASSGKTSPASDDAVATADTETDTPLRRAGAPVPGTVHQVASARPAVAKPDDASTGAMTTPPMQDNATQADASAASPQSITATAASSSTVAPAAPGADARAAQAAYQLPAAQAIPQVAFEIARQAAAGNSRFQIRLDPPELGRIDVKLDVDKHGSVTARMTVEKSETLDLMQRDQRSLEKALQQAGLDGQKTNLEFSLKQGPSGGGNGQSAGRELPIFSGGAASEPEAATTAVTSIYRGTASPGGVNLFV